MTSQTFILELPIKADDSQSRTIAKKFEYGRMLYNATLGSGLGRLTQMRQDPEWRRACEMSKGKERNELFRRLNRKYRLTEYDFHADIARHREGTKRKSELGINEAQKLATQAFSAVSRYMYKQGGRPRFKSFKRGLHSLEGKTNKTGLKFRPEKMLLDWCRKSYQVMLDSDDAFILDALYADKERTHFKRIKYNRIVCRNIKGVKRFYLQVVLEGTPPVKHAYAPATERMAIDPGPKSFAVFCPRVQAKVQVAPGAKVNEKAIRRIQRSMDRSLRASNPKAFDEKGRIKSGVGLTYSKGYQARVDKLREAHRRAAGTRKCEHGELANLLLECAGNIRIEKNSWEAFKRSHFGRSINNSAASGFIQRLKSKAERAGLTVEEVSPYRLKPSQYDPYKDEFMKKALGERWMYLGDETTVIQRDIISAILIYFADLKNQTHNPEVVKAALEGLKRGLTDAGYVKQLKLPRSSGSQDPLFAPEPKALTTEELRSKCFRAGSDRHSSTLNGTDGKAVGWSETFPLQRGVV